MHFRFGNMESFLIVGMVLVLYTTLVKTAIHDEVIKALTSDILDDVKYNRQMATESNQKDARVSLASKRNENVMNHADVGSALKKEIIHALVKILHDELEKKTTVQLLKKQIMDTFTKNDLRNELSKKRATGKLSERDTTSPANIWKRHEEESNHVRRKDEDENVAADDIMRRRLLRGPPGLWGKDVSEKSKLVSDEGPPGLWGRDTSKVLLTADENEKFPDELSDTRLFRKDDHRRRERSRDAAKVMLAAEEDQKFSDELSNVQLLRKDEKAKLSNSKPSSV